MPRLFGHDTARLPYSPACSRRGSGAGMTTGSAAGPFSPSNSTSWMRAPRFSIFSAEMRLQFQHPLVQAFEVVYEMADLGMNLVGSLAHARIFLNLLNDLDGEHQQRW